MASLKLINRLIKNPDKYWRCCLNLTGCVFLIVASNPLACAQSAKFAEPEDVKLTTKDGVHLRATYYASSKGKKAIPVVMLHDYKESRALFHSLAKSIQHPKDPKQDSHAVLTVDLRGHGDSTVAENDYQGRRVEIEVDRLKTQDFRNMVLFDMEAIRKFLVTKNDAGELNLNKLCLLGSGLGANVAVSWSAVDWSAPELPRIKQGQDVKGLILASPRLNSHGLALIKPLRHPGVQREISLFVVYGDGNAKAKKDAKTMYKNLEKYHLPVRGKFPELISLPHPTELQGTKLFTDPQFKMLPRIQLYLKAHLTEQEYEWSKRRLH